MIDIVNKRFWFLLLSGLILIICIVASLALGIRPSFEFRSGSMMTVSFEQKVEQAQLKAELVTLGYASARVQRTEAGPYLIRTPELSDEDKARLESGLAQKFGRLTENQFFSVSPLVATETVQNAAIAVAAAAIGMLLFIIWAFRKMPNPIHYGTCAIIALLHDVAIIAGIFAIIGKILNWEIDLMFIIGVLTIIGYSINNVIVVFDRIRENVTREISSDFRVVVNSSIVQTLTRSLNTSLTTIFAVLALTFFVGSSLQNLTVVLLIGISAGTFSSVFIAPLLLVVWEGAGWGFPPPAVTAAKAKNG